MKSEVFNKELNLINDNNIKENAKIILNNLPDYFYTIAASSTGKYHPSFSLGDKGLVRHTKAAVFYAKELFGIYKFSSETKDLIILSILIHDGIKKGNPEEKYTRFDHPVLISNLIDSIKNKLTLTEIQINEIKQMTSSHMGRWNTSEFSNITLPLPKTVNQKFVHMCDYLSSRKPISITFDDYNNIIE